MSFAPDFVIIGMPKAGTTSLYEALSRHTRTDPSRVKEPYYWSSDLLDTLEQSPAHLGKRFSRMTAETYRSLFSGNGLRFEASTNSIFSPKAPYLLKEANPSCKAILILREPRSWIASWHAQLRRDGWEPRDLETAYAQSGDASTHPMERSFYYDYRSTATPTTYVRRWKRCFAADLLVIAFDDLLDWTNSRTRILSHIGLAHERITLEHANRSEHAHRWLPPREDLAPGVHELEELTGLPLTRTWGYDRSTELFYT